MEKKKQIPSRSPLLDRCHRPKRSPCILDAALAVNRFVPLPASSEKDEAHDRSEEDDEEEEECSPGPWSQSLSQRHALCWQQTAQAQHVAQRPTHRGVARLQDHKTKYDCNFKAI